MSTKIAKISFFCAFLFKNCVKTDFLIKYLPIFYAVFTVNLKGVFKMKQQKKITALYCRLSRDDETEGYNSSIMTQMQILSRYAKQHGMNETEFYIDNGYSGTNYDRPDFKRLKSDIEAGKVSTVITKDLSRLGRDYLQTGNFIENFFPEYGVRYIALHDGVDTFMGDNDFMPFKNIINEWYARDVSKKVRAAKRAKALNGEFTASYAPYGYMKSPENKRKLVPNPETADVLKRIFQMAASGVTAFQIGSALRRDKILKPRAYTMQSTGGKYQTDDLVKYPYDWSRGSIRGIIQNEVYLGHMVCNKHTTKSFKNKALILNDRSEWIITRNTHEPLVDDYTFQQAQKATEVKRRTFTGEPHIFAGLLRCADCGKSMHYLKRNDRLSSATYRCNTYSRYSKAYCSMHYTSYEEMYDFVLKDIRRYAKLAKNKREEFMEILNKAESGKTAKQLAHYEKEIAESEKRLNEISLINKQLYEDNFTGKVVDERFYEMSRNFEYESEELRTRAREAQKAVISYNDASTNSLQFVALIQKYFKIKELSAPVLNELINKIEVYEREKSKRKQRIDIHYNFVGMIKRKSD